MQQRPWFAAASAGCVVLALYWLRWSYLARHDWPTGESGLGALVTMVFLTAAASIGGIVAGAISLGRKERPRWLAITAIVVNVAVLFLGWVGVFVLISLT